jgi:hypothetical protein
MVDLFVHLQRTQGAACDRKQSFLTSSIEEAM